MKTRVVVLGAGFGGLELTTILSEALGDEIDVLLIDKRHTFVFGFSKLEVMFGRQMAADAHHPYRDFVKPGVRFLQSTIKSIDPVQKRVVTEHGTFDADILVVALGADLDPSATPGLVEGGHEFYTVEGAEALRDVLPTFQHGHAVIGVTSTPFKCPPAPSETALLLHDYLVERGYRDQTDITLVMPFDIPVPPSPETSEALMTRFAARGIQYIKDSVVVALDPDRRVAKLNDGREIPYDIFLGVPVHCVPSVIEESGLAQNGWIPVNAKTLETKFPDVYAVGDVTSVGTAKAGEFAEGAARVVAARIIAQLRGEPEPEPYLAQGTCYMEMGNGEVGRVDVTFLVDPHPTARHTTASTELAAEKLGFSQTRLRRWFGTGWKKQ